MRMVKRGKIGIAAMLLSIAGFALEPIRTQAATSTGSSTITATVAATISISTSTTVGLNVTPTAGGAVTSSSDTITVNTNNSAGYNLTMADTDANTNLVSGGNTIPANTGTQAAPTALGANTWGYRVVNVGGFGATAYTAETNNTSSASTWAGVPANGSPNTIKTTAATATNDVTSVWYAVKATTAKPTGTYTGTVTYTAITN